MSLRRAPIVLLSGLLMGAALLAAPPAAAPARPVTADFVPAPAAPGEIPAPLAAALATVTSESLGGHIRFLAGPGLEGRGLGQRGLELAAEYAAAALQGAGLAPFGAPEEAAPGGLSYYQPVPVRAYAAPAGELEVARRDGATAVTRTFRSGVDCRFAPAPPLTLAAPAVFAGYGLRTTEPARDDFRGLDVRGKVVVILAGLPAGAEWERKELVERYAASDPDDRWEAKLETAATLGAMAVLGVEGDELAAELLKPGADAGFFRPYEPRAAELPPLVRVSHAVAAELLAGGGPGATSSVRAAPAAGAAVVAPAAATPLLSASPRLLAGVTVTLRLAADERLIAARNVLAILPGADPRLREEAVVLGAHLDHLGKVGEVVYPGADDDASGVAGLLEIARAFARSSERPKRTVIFAFWSGEEEGKFGSGFYVRHPRWPLAKTTAYLNLDMIGHPWLPEELRKLVTDAGLPDGEKFLAGLAPADFVEPGLPPGVPELEAALRHAAAATGLALHFDFTDGRHGGSDYRDFARAGVPFVRFFGNYFPAYHEPGDTAAALDAGQVRRVARLALATAFALANP